MKIKYFLVFLLSLVVLGCGPQPKDPEQVMLKVNEYEVTKSEFDAGFAQSAFADRADRVQARADYMDNLINQKLILLDAQKKGIDKDKDFMKSIERFWEQSLMTVALGDKTRAIDKTLVVSDQEIRRFYESMVKEGITTKSFEEVYPQIQWQAKKQMQTRLIDEWLKELRSNAQLSVNRELLKQNN